MKLKERYLRLRTRGMSIAGTPRRLSDLREKMMPPNWLARATGKLLFVSLRTAKRASAVAKLWREHDGRPA